MRTDVQSRGRTFRCVVGLVVGALVGSATWTEAQPMPAAPPVTFPSPPGSIGQAATPPPVPRPAVPGQPVVPIPAQVLPGRTPSVLSAPPAPGEAPTTPTIEASQPPSVETRVEPLVTPELSPIERLLAGEIEGSEAPLRQFGYTLFHQLPSTFAPVTDVPVGLDYVIGPGDSLNIVLWGGVQEAYQVEIDRNGAITVPRLGVVQVTGFTLQQLQIFLRRRFGEYYPDFQMAVTLGKLRTIRVYVIGEVQQPGAYTISSLSTIINALFISGGPAKNGTLRRIHLVRNGKAVHTLDLYNFLIRGDKSQDRTLQSDDTIFVSVIGPVAGVAGNVKRPAIYELTPGTTLRALVDLAGGVAPSGYLQRVHVERFEAHEKRVVVDLDLSTAAVPGKQDVWQTLLQDGDLIRVFPVVPTLVNVLYVEGHVVRPGQYELKPGMRLRDVLPNHMALLPEPHVEYAEIVRLLPPDQRRHVLSFNLGALLAGDLRHNVMLQPQDRVRIFARSEFVDPRFVRISGLVHKPGLYPLTEGMRIRDLVLRAGDVHKLAYLENAELSRHVLSAGGDLTTRVEINLRAAFAEDAEHNLELQDFDHLLIRQVPGVELRGEIEQVGETPETTIFPLHGSDEAALEALRRSGILQELTIVLRGEVRFPGLYPIQKGERLSSVIRRAGGVTDSAYLRGAVFTRQSVQVAQEKRFQELILEEEQALLTESAAETEGALSTEEVLGRRQALTFRRDLLTRLRTVKPEGRVVVQLRPLEVFAGSEQDIELEAGDSLIIPQIPKVVNVLGEVYNRTALIYEPGKDLGYYLAKVGGLKPNANEKEIALIQVDGTVFSNTQDRFLLVRADGNSTYLGDFFAIRPQPGDTIVVPRRVETPATLRNTRDIVQIIFQSISVVAVIAALL